ncbi:MAG: lactate racemase domain-containing protein, partial [Acidobacteriota bacterium]
MIEQSLPYGDSTLRVSLPDRARLVGGGDDAPRVPPTADQEAAVREALAHPLGLPPVAQFARPGARVLIAFDAPTG